MFEEGGVVELRPYDGWFTSDASGWTFTPDGEQS
jgi:hypothetical protein